MHIPTLAEQIAATHARIREQLLQRAYDLGAQADRHEFLFIAQRRAKDPSIAAQARAHLMASADSMRQMRACLIRVHVLTDYTFQTDRAPEAFRANLARLAMQAEGPLSPAQINHVAQRSGKLAAARAQAA